jgi:alkanesulfonate monooxygenase SsuD/methylene tetrahydromethanopterin reductase-like flavin-dependent oxidoreductase (luciferase family)
MGARVVAPQASRQHRIEPRSTTMKIGIALPNVVPGTSGDDLLHWSRRAEELGFASLAVIDRVVYDSYEPLVTLAMAAAVTQRIELVTNVLIAPQHRTALLAKQAASIDRVSGGRLTLGLGVGLRADDFAACEAPMRGRGARFDTQLTDLQTIFGGVAGIGPAPARAGGPELLIGGDAAIAGPRAARHGAGWTMMVGTPEQFAAGAETVRRAWRAAGRSDEPRLMAVFYAATGPDATDLVATSVGHYYAWLGPELAAWITGTAALGERAIAERIAQFADAGATEIVLAPCTADRNQLERLAAVAAPVSA